MPQLFNGASLFEVVQLLKFCGVQNACTLHVKCTSCSGMVLANFPFSSVHTVDIVEKRLTPPNVNSREMCAQTMGYCQFYTHCIEELFHCGHMGFALNYARQRCGAIRRLHTSSENCKTCVRDEVVVKWAQASEKCLQEKLHHLVLNEFHNFTQTRHPNSQQDPTTCLELERRAIEEMNNCYQSESLELCSALDLTPEVESFQKDLSTVVDAFHVGGEYYRNVVEAGVVKTIHNCSHPNSSMVATSLISNPLPVRVVLCVNDSRYHYPPNHVHIEEVRQWLMKNQSLPEVVYSGLDVQNSCAKASLPGSVNVDRNILRWHFFTFFVPSNATLLQNTFIEKYTSHSPKAGFLQYFEYPLQRESTLCGDGKRQAGELCDYSGTSNSSCEYFTCSPQPWWECSTERLQASHCWKETCGDGLRTHSEQCDDANNNTSDGCSSDCHIEANYSCTNSYNRTSQCTEIISEELPTPLYIEPSSTVSSVVSVLPTPSESSLLPTTFPLYSSPLVSSTKSLSSPIVTSTPVSSTHTQSPTSAAKTVISRTVLLSQTLVLALIVTLICR